MNHPPAPSRPHLEGEHWMPTEASPLPQVHDGDGEHCEWCGHCKGCYPHQCYHQGDPCATCGTLMRDRPVPVHGDYRGMCQPPFPD